ncbi:hypothetical protein JCGZ_12463 [Jatropha curcas]|uniref:Uncharacterized protein n=1 Tax=Jatropha curcas TaxID=180498 RepID=A0A067K7A9_JATCU|nr:PAMP-induced secreted peptide 2 [Jatropha curcas]KDP32002.1 hypothetical protein JCGZ_12463 [Jatropha curcas]
MARDFLNYLVRCFLFVLLFLGSKTQARPLNTLESHGPRVRDKGFFDGLFLGAIKQSGPSPGQGNRLTDSRSFGGINKDGPSPGQGH